MNSNQTDRLEDREEKQSYEKPKLQKVARLQDITAGLTLN